jgi:hypothetical protein
MFDLEARTRIRTALIAYMTGHKIGVPTLAQRVSDANTRKPEVPIKTLQRFLAGEMRTNDGFVGLCARFAEGLPVPDPVGDLGRAMVSLYRGQTSRLVGDYMTTPFGPELEYEGVPSNDSTNAWFITSIADNGFCRVTMKVEPTHAILDGAAVLAINYEVISMADRLTNEPVHLTLNTFAVPLVFSGPGLLPLSTFKIRLERLGD